MVSIEQVVQRSVNPFDDIVARNFWSEQQSQERTIESIHAKAIQKFEDSLDLVKQDHRTRTLLMLGASGSGKTHLLGRLKSRLNSNACFVYIEPFPDSQYIWRHILRYTVDSLMQVPAGQSESQLSSWLKGLTHFRGGSAIDRLFSDRQVFVRNMRASHPIGMYRSKEFFGVLYELAADRDLLSLACDWLRGEELDESDLKGLNVRRAIDSEEDAQKILLNFGHLAVETQPIVLCFDQLDSIACDKEGKPDFPALFRCNSSLHSQNLTNFLIVISVVRDTWKQESQRLLSADLARIDSEVELKTITTDEAAALWQSRLSPLHSQADSPPQSPLFPLSRNDLDRDYPRGRILPRTALMLGKQLFQRYKLDGFPQSPGGNGSTSPTVVSPNPPKPFPGNGSKSNALASFKLLWTQELEKSRTRISHIKQLSAPELVQLLRDVLSALELKPSPTGILPSQKYKSYSLGFQAPEESGQMGIVWSEEPNLTKFCNLMKACDKVNGQKSYSSMVLLRGADVGSPKNKSYQLYTRIFQQSPNRHLKVDLDSVHLLATYRYLANSARSGELVVGDRVVNLDDLKSFVRDIECLQGCRLLQNLGIFDLSPEIVAVNPPSPKPDLEQHLFNLVQTQHFIARSLLVSRAASLPSAPKAADVDRAIHQLCQQNKVRILDPNAPADAQLVCLIPSQS